MALNKSTFLDILNEILSQPAIPTPEMTSYVSVTDRSPKYVCIDDQMSVSRRTPQTNWDTLLSNDSTSGLPCYDEYTTMSPFARCRQSTASEPVNIHDVMSEWNCGNGKPQSQSTSSLPIQRLPPNTLRDDYAFTEVATDLTTVDRRCSTSIGSSQRQGDEAANLCRSFLEGSGSPESVEDVCLQSPEHLSPSADQTDVRVTAEDLSLSQDAADVDEVEDDLEYLSSSSSATLSPDCGNTASSTGVTSQSLSSCHSVPGEIMCAFGTNAEVSPRESWMAIDKTLLHDVVDQMLYHDIIFDFSERHDATCPFPTCPFPVDNYFTGSSLDSWSRNAEMMMASAQRRLPDGDIMLHNLLSFNSPRPEPEMSQQSVMSSSLYWHRPGSSNKVYRMKKRSMLATTDLAAKRRCRVSDRRNAHSFAVRVKTQNNDMKCSDDDDNNTPGNKAHSPSLKWKSTMLLRLRSEIETPGSCIPVTAAT